MESDGISILPCIGSVLSKLKMMLCALIIIRIYFMGALYPCMSFYRFRRLKLKWYNHLMHMNRPQKVRQKNLIFWGIFV
ncbi:MAG: hypothetical protein FWG92_03975, partial [Leptospirales bacterium]|nr:hypothetical protein [Leptospirales bacterium]